MTDVLRIQGNSRRAPAANFLLGREMERELLVRSQMAKWKESAGRHRAPNLAGHRICTIFCAMLDFMHLQAWRGACHASSAVFHVLLREQGVDSVLCHGMVEKGTACFSHSWVEIGGRIYDVAISNTISREFDSPPVFAGIDLATARNTDLTYGVQSAQYSDQIAVFVLNSGFNAYMDAFPHHNRGLWGVAKDVGKRIGVRLNVAKLRAAYANTTWTERPARDP